MSVLENIAAQRQKLLDGIDANEGDINLRIFEDFYPDEAHFIYELLQNAEDAGATEVKFELTAHACFFEHNGSRHFNERDIRGITGIFNSSKKNNTDKIGKFGVGFKSVFVYTDTPFIYSKDYSFKILKLVLPQQIKPKEELGDKTRFEFPFNNPKKNVKTAFSEVKAGLEQLSETTLLYLNNLRYISWRIGEQEGAVLREEHSTSHVEVLKLSDGKEVLSSHWLRFAAPVQNVDKFTAPMEGVERQKVAVAFELAFVGDVTSFDEKKPLAKQLKIVPALRGKVAVFFPAEKETSGLRFHVHAPFIPELSRASIKSSPENLPLFEQLAAVTASSLHEIKALGLLTGEFLSVLPNNDDNLPARYDLILKAVLEEMACQPLVPTHAGGHAPASRLLSGSANIKALLKDTDLALVTDRDDSPAWVVNIPQRNSRLDKFLTSLDIQEWDVQDFLEFFKNRASYSHRYQYMPQGRVNNFAPSVKTWLMSQTDAWHQSLYSFLYKYVNDLDEYKKKPCLSILRNAYIVRLSDDACELPENAYFSTGPVNAKDPLPRVKESVLTDGKDKKRQENARKFLETLGVREPGEKEEIVDILKRRYSSANVTVKDVTYLKDSKKFIAFANQFPHEMECFESAHIFRVDKTELAWVAASEVYVDQPFQDTGLTAYYGELSSDKKTHWPLGEWYVNCGIDLKDLAKFADKLGCKTDFKELFLKAQCSGNPEWKWLRKAEGQRSTNPVDTDYKLYQSHESLLRSKNVNFAKLVWQTMCKYGDDYLLARYQKNNSYQAHGAPSQLVYWLKKIEWIPLQDGRFVTPREANSNELWEGFVYDENRKWFAAVEFGAEKQEKSNESIEKKQKLKECGVECADDEAVRRLAKFSRLSEAQQKSALAKEDKKEDKSDADFPVKPVRNPERRSQRIQELTEQTSQRRYQTRSRSVDIDYGVAKEEARAYLREQYKDPDQVMFCQACGDELPFKLPNGEYYFKAVGVVERSPKHLRETFLALCPNHAAAFKHANPQIEKMKELVTHAEGLEITLELGGKNTVVKFTEQHLLDIRACWAADDLVDVGGSNQPPNP